MKSSMLHDRRRIGQIIGLDGVSRGCSGYEQYAPNATPPTCGPGIPAGNICPIGRLYLYGPTFLSTDWQTYTNMSSGATMSRVDTTAQAIAISKLVSRRSSQLYVRCRFRHNTGPVGYSKRWWIDSDDVNPTGIAIQSVQDRLFVTLSGSQVQFSVATLTNGSDYSLVFTWTTAADGTPTVTWILYGADYTGLIETQTYTGTPGNIPATQERLRMEAFGGGVGFPYVIDTLWFWGPAPSDYTKACTG